MTARTTVLVLAAALLTLVGCSTNHPGATNRFGAVQSTLIAPPSRVAAAAEEVLKDMNIPILTSAATAIDGKVIGETARDKKITITIELKGADASLITIRHGTIGDENISVTILERIEDKLGIGNTVSMDPSLKTEEPAAEPAPAVDDSEAK